jgi:hypothetical protein
MAQLAVAAAALQAARKRCMCSRRFFSDRATGMMMHRKSGSAYGACKPMQLKATVAGALAAVSSSNSRSIGGCQQRQRQLHVHQLVQQLLQVTSLK